MRHATDPWTYGEDIRRAREAKGMSQEALANALGVATIAISRWENHSASPRYENRLGLAEVLGFSPEELGIPTFEGGAQKRELDAHLKRIEDLLKEIRDACNKDHGVSA